MLSLKHKTASKGQLIAFYSRNTVRKEYRRIDIWVTFLLVPFLAITIPHLTGLLAGVGFERVESILNCLFFITIAEIIYKGNMYFLHAVRMRSGEVRMPFSKIILLYFMVNIAYSGVIALASLSNWSLYAAGGPPFSQPVLITTLVIVVCVLFINNMYEIFYLRTEKKSSLQKLQTLERARQQAEFEALNSHLDPHFLYNALTSISYTLIKNPQLAEMHHARLAALYRYVLKMKGKLLTCLEAELKFCHDYVAIQQLRFGDTIMLQVVKGDVIAQEQLVPPLSLQVLVENAIKHNEFSESKPLLITIHLQSDSIIVTNNINRPAFCEHGSGTGLKNLNQRLSIVSSRPLNVEESPTDFRVTVPAVLSRY